MRTPFYKRKFSFVKWFHLYDVIATWANRNAWATFQEALFSDPELKELLNAEPGT
jgi:hypothetical protein